MKIKNLNEIRSKVMKLSNRLVKQYDLNRATSLKLAWLIVKAEEQQKERINIPEYNGKTYKHKKYTINEIQNLETKDFGYTEIEVIFSADCSRTIKRHALKKLFNNENYYVLSNMYDFDYIEDGEKQWGKIYEKFPLLDDDEFTYFDAKEGVQDCTDVPDMIIEGSGNYFYVYFLWGETDKEECVKCRKYTSYNMELKKLAEYIGCLKDIKTFKELKYIISELDYCLENIEEYKSKLNKMGVE